MTITGIDLRQRGLREWEEWLESHFPSAHVTRARPSRATQAARSRAEAVWHVEFGDGKLGRIHVTGEALNLRSEAFVEVAKRLSRTDWYACLDQMIRIRIHENGRITNVEGGLKRSTQ